MTNNNKRPPKRYQCPLPSCKREFVYYKAAEKRCLGHKLWEEDK